VMLAQTSLSKSGAYAKPDLLAAQMEVKPTPVYAGTYLTLTRYLHVHTYIYLHRYLHIYDQIASCSQGAWTSVGPYSG
jgi:hypothetical protein